MKMGDVQRCRSHSKDDAMCLRAIQAECRPQITSSPSSRLRLRSNALARCSGISGRFSHSASLAHQSGNSRMIDRCTSQEVDLDLAAPRIAPDMRGTSFTGCVGACGWRQLTTGYRVDVVEPRGVVRATAHLACLGDFVTSASQAQLLGTSPFWRA